MDYILYTHVTPIFHEHSSTNDSMTVATRALLPKNSTVYIFNKLGGNAHGANVSMYLHFVLFLTKVLNLFHTEKNRTPTIATANSLRIF